MRICEAWFRYVKVPSIRTLPLEPIEGYNNSSKNDGKRLSMFSLLLKSTLSDLSPLGIVKMFEWQKVRIREIRIIDAFLLGDFQRT